MGFKIQGFCKTSEKYEVMKKQNIFSSIEFDVLIFLNVVCLQNSYSNIPQNILTFDREYQYVFTIQCFSISAKDGAPCIMVARQA